MSRKVPVELLEAAERRAEKAEAERERLEGVLRQIGAHLHPQMTSGCRTRGELDAHIGPVLDAIDEAFAENRRDG